MRPRARWRSPRRWIWRELDPREDGKLVSVWDVTGASASRWGVKVAETRTALKPNGPGVTSPPPFLFHASILLPSSLRYPPFHYHRSLPPSLVGDRKKMMTQTMAVIAAHYPERSDKLFIVNAPW